VLSDPVQRRVYDEIHGYALTAINPFLDDTAPRDHAFVDEFSCIGKSNLSSKLLIRGQFCEVLSRPAVCIAILA